MRVRACCMSCTWWSKRRSCAWFRRVVPLPKRRLCMLNDTLKRRLSRDRKMTSITLRIPQAVVDSMKAIAPVRGMTRYHTLPQSYIGEGLRRDEAQYLSADAPARLPGQPKARGAHTNAVETPERDRRP